MADENDRIHLDTNEARAGSTPGVTRYVLIASLVLVIAIFAAILLS
ncbi:hypothetical protein [Sphingomonas sp.]|jgi:hypothetical protein